MFTRSATSSKSKPAETTVKLVDPAARAQTDANTAAASSAPRPASSALSQGTREAKHYSIISNDLTIMGQDLKIISKGALKVDGEIQGEIRGVDIIVSENGKVTGTISAQSVIIDGKVMGTVQAAMVTLRKKAHVEGDVHHTSLTIEEGAIFDGRSRRHEDAAELAPQLDVQGQTPSSSPPVSAANMTDAVREAATTPPPLSG